MTIGLVLLVAIALLLGLAPLRRAWFTGRVFSLYRRILPRMSDTEREALEAGTVWWEGELFRGNPDWNRLLSSRSATAGWSFPPLPIRRW